MPSQKAEYKYNVLIRFENDVPAITELLNSVIEVSFESKLFSDYTECFTSCQAIMTSLASRINKRLNEETFKVGIETSPLITNQPPRSKDWDPAELCRLWIFNKKMENGDHIQAIGKSSVIVQRTPIDPKLLN